MATSFSVIAVGCMAISASYHSLTLQVAVSLNTGATSVIGNVIGEEDSLMSIVLAIVSYIEGTIIYTIIALLTYTYSHEIATIYSSDNPDTAATLAVVLESLIPQIWLISQVLCLQGTLKAVQRQRIASSVLILCLYLVSLPMATWLAFDEQMGVKGLWLGFSLGNIPVIFMYVIIIFAIDWNLVIEEASIQR